MCPGIVGRLGAPIEGRKQAGRSQNHDRVDQEGQHGELHLAGLDLLAEILGRPPDHQSRQKHAHNQVDEQVDHAHPLAAEDAVEPHARQGRDAGQRIQAVVHAVDRTAGDGGRDCRIGRAGRGAEAQLFPFEVPQLLIDGKAGNRGDDDRLWSDMAVGAEHVDLIRLTRRVGQRAMRSQRRVGLERVPIDGPADRHEEQDHHRSVEDGRVPHVPQHAAEHDHQRKREQQDVHAREEVGPGVGVLVRVGRVGSEKTAPVCPQVLNGDDRSDGSAGDLLEFGGTGIVGSHRSCFERGDFGRRLERHGDALSHQEHAHHEAGGEEDVGDDPPHVDVVIPHVGVAAQAPHDGCQSTEADARREEHVGHNERDLAEVREVLFAGVILQVGVREERRH